MAAGRKRSLGREDARLWARIVATVTPLPGKSAPALPPEDAVAAGSVVQKIDINQNVKKSVPQPNQTQVFETRLKRQLGRGRASIDARLDLHGLRQDEAHRALRSFLVHEQARGSRVVLVITGKGKSQSLDPYAETGVLRRQVPLWLSAPDLRALVVSHEEAGRGHGGEGAIYIQLRRKWREGA